MRLSASWSGLGNPEPTTCAANASSCSTCFCAWSIYERRRSLDLGAPALDMTGATNLIRLLQETQPDEIYNLAAQSHVQVSFETPKYTANADALGTLRLLEAIRILRLENKTRFYQASTSELFGSVQGSRSTRPPRFIHAPLCDGEAVRLLDHRELPRGIRALCKQRHTVQSRRADARRNFHHAQGHACGGCDRGGKTGLLLSRKLGSKARLGLGARLCRGDVAHLAAS
ncbi:hypothetical protein BQ8794_240203 [Mesorhizobium prunaredense]|uniref:GDP-mannose 4,6-dehydratase n=1 Tax=Mesorhizobium prunaredense TaxID=1631249 RepID=A0A1R3V7W1_9HYPH|nr:hypothetical protein BQ8794_240203 [Mesorhizobium prunaredense]